MSKLFLVLVLSLLIVKVLQQKSGFNLFKVTIEAYKFLSNEYRHFPMRFQINLCDAFAENAGGIANSLKCGNLTGCQFRKDVWYHSCNFVVNQDKLPPLFPNGRYMMDLQGLFKEEEVGVVSVYFMISRQIPIPDK